MEEKSEVITLFEKALTKKNEQSNLKLTGELQRVAKASCAWVRKTTCGYFVSS